MRISKAGSYNSRRRSTRLKFSGFTLMELLVVIAIMGAVMALGVGVVRVTFDLDLERVSGELSSAIRYLYGEAARRGEVYRLVLNLDDHSYSVESAANSPEVFAELAADSKQEKNNAEEKEEEESDGDGEEKPPEGFTAADDAMVKPKKIAPVFFKDVVVSHRDDKQEEGIVYLYFFPNGATEYAIINLTDEEGEACYSIEINPLTGKTKARSDCYENPY